MPDNSEEETRDQRRTRQTGQLYAAIGRYTVAFELMVHAIRTGCVTFTSVSPTHQRLMNVIFHHKSMSARAMFDIYRSMIAEHVSQAAKPLDDEEDDEELRAITGVLKTLAKRYGDACDDRNDHVHATWIIGHGNDETEDFSSAAFLKGNATAEGLQFLPGPKTVEDLDALAAECKVITDMVYLFHAAYCTPGLRVSKNFIKRGKYWVIPDRTA
jgi:hypothetical protein